MDCKDKGLFLRKDGVLLGVGEGGRLEWENGVKTDEGSWLVPDLEGDVDLSIDLVGEAVLGKALTEVSVGLYFDEGWSFSIDLVDDSVVGKGVVETSDNLFVFEGDSNTLFDLIGDGDRS